jgi:hypothetical protein
MMEIDQRRDRDARRAYLCHSGASNGVQHPGGDDRNHAGHHLDVNKSTGYPLLAVMPPNTAPIERVPGIVNFNFRPDMGRMTG